MSFIGSIESPMTESGLYELLDSTFVDVQKMMTGKKFLQNMRALRIVVEELLRLILTGGTVNDMHGFESILSDISNRSKTSHLWIDCVIKAVFIMMMYIRAERAADWCLQLTEVKKMLPYFFAIWSLLLAYYGGNAKIMSGTIPRRRTCHALCPRALEWYLD